MGFRRRSRWIGVALVVVLAIGAPLTAAAQARGAGGAQAPAGGAQAPPGGRRLLRPAHRVGVVALTRTPVHPTRPQQEPRT